MAKPAADEFRRAGVASPEPAAPLGDRWYAKLGLLLLAIGLLTLSFAPLGQFYLAWVGLVPWLLVVRRVKSQRAAFLWSWLAGVIFFTANMWWLWNVTGPGMVALMIILGLYWSVAAVVIRGTGVLSEEWLSGGGAGGRGRKKDSTTPPLHYSTTRPLLSVLLIAATWVSLEWVRGNYPLNGLPWLFLGHSQTPVLPLCQVADTTGVYGISFWIAAVNALVALFILHRFNLRRLLLATAMVAAMVVLALGYGLWRMSQTDRLTPGPTVMVVQSNYPQSNTGEKGAPIDELVDYHVRHTREALEQSPAHVDLVVWSETMMPPLNRRARVLARGDEGGYEQFLEATHERLKNLAYEHKTALLVGALYVDAQVVLDPSAPNGERVIDDKRNTAFFYDRTGHMSDDPADRYDKIHIVPFGEYLPFRTTLPMLYKLFLSLSPYDAGYFLNPGDEGAITTFRLQRAGDSGGTPTAPAPATATAERPWRFVTPICFEDIDPLLVAKMFRGRAGESRGGGKQADFIVNITNDGWFKANQMPQHLQAARFRSIENRAPTARSVNTGISGFVDSFGRVHDLVPAGREGTSVQTLQLDSRTTLYTRFGDGFALLCAAATTVTAAAAVLGWWKGRRVRAAA